MPVLSNLNKDYKVRDPIYGFVKLDAQEMDIINSQYFQRLRRIRQLSFTEMIYPGANHTRFEHSLGVVQMVSDMFDSIVSKKNSFENLSITKEAIPRIRKIIRLAALLHDIGHSPFSHAGEDAMPHRPRVKKGDKVDRYEHEDYSRAAIKLIFKDMIENHPFVSGLSIKATDVSALLDDKTIPPTRESIIWKELISGQMDADRADYLLRDSLHLGVNYGLYDRNRLVSCITMGKNQETGENYLAIEDGGWHVAESLVIARYQMFSQVYFHPVRRAFDYHVGKATIESLKYLGFADGLFPPPTSEENLKKYLELDDWSMFGAFKQNRGGDHGKIILLREPYKCKKEWDNDLLEKDRKKVNADLKRFKGFLDESASTKWYKLDKDIPIYDFKTAQYYPLTYKSKLIETMPNLPKVTRLFVEQEGEGRNYEFNV